MPQNNTQNLKMIVQDDPQIQALNKSFFENLLTKMQNRPAFSIILGVSGIILLISFIAILVMLCRSRNDKNGQKGQKGDSIDEVEVQEFEIVEEAGYVEK